MAEITKWHQEEELTSDRMNQMVGEIKQADRSIIEVHEAESIRYDAVLINGFNGYVTYSKTPHGIVTLAISINALTTNASNTIICMIPVGFRPACITVVPLNRSNNAPYTPTIGMYVSPAGALSLAHENNITVQDSAAGITGVITYLGVN